MKTNEINNEIKETICSYYVSKLLKEKGFSVDCLYHYDETGELKENFEDIFVNPTFNNEKISVCNLFRNNDDVITNENDKPYEIISAPTHAVAVQWLIENFGIYIYWTPYENSQTHFTKKQYFGGTIYTKNKNFEFVGFTESIDTITELSLVTVLSKLV